MLAHANDFLPPSFSNMFLNWFQSWKIPIARGCCNTGNNMFFFFPFNSVTSKCHVINSLKTRRWANASRSQSEALVGSHSKTATDVNNETNLPIRRDIPYFALCDIHRFLSALLSCRHAFKCWNAFGGVHSGYYLVKTCIGPGRVLET